MVPQKLGERQTAGKFVTHPSQRPESCGVSGRSARRERETAHNKHQRGEPVSKEMNQTPK